MIEGYPEKGAGSLRPQISDRFGRKFRIALAANFGSLWPQTVDLLLPMLFLLRRCSIWCFTAYSCVALGKEGPPLLPLVRRWLVVHFVWQVQHVVLFCVVSGGRYGTFCKFLRHFAWQVWPLSRHKCTLRRRCSISCSSASFHVAGVALCATQVFLAWQMQYFFLFCIIARTVAGVALCWPPYSCYSSSCGRCSISCLCSVGSLLSLCGRCCISYSSL